MNFIGFTWMQPIYISLTIAITPCLHKFNRNQVWDSLTVALTKLNFVSPRIAPWISEMQSRPPAWPLRARLNDKSSSLFPILKTKTSQVAACLLSFLLSTNSASFDDWWNENRKCNISVLIQWQDSITDH